MTLTQKQMLLIVQFLLILFSLNGPVAAKESTLHKGKHTASNETRTKSGLDRSGHARKGKVSYYSHKFYEKKMANGKPMKPHSNVAASKTLPLGTKAKVTNLKTGKSAIVVIEDRGPYIKDRIIDVSPQTAEKIDLKDKGVAPVEVKPLEIPKNDDIKPDESKSKK